MEGLKSMKVCTYGMHKQAVNARFGLTVKPQHTSFFLNE